MTVYEAVRFEGEKEREFVDPVVSIEFFPDKFTIHNGDHGFDYPLAEFNQWVFRPLETD